MNIFTYDHLPPQTIAMLQSLYSRSPRSVVEHLQQVKEAGSDKFMSQFYVGYGHKSIGDCGTTTIFLEDVSMLAAKAIQDYPLYNGQEASTRYMDMASRPLIDPVGLEEPSWLQRGWMKLYADTLAAMTRYFERTYPIQPGERESLWRKSILARAFDVARGFLPAGATTYVSWHTNLRQAWDRIRLLQHHPLVEVRNLAANLLTQLQEKYPASFCHKVYPESEAFLEKTADSAYAHPSLGIWSGPGGVGRPGFGNLGFYDRGLHHSQNHLWMGRPPKTELPRATEAFGRIRFSFPLDFGSYRDLQRHRSAYQAMPLLTPTTFHWWYMQQILQAPEGQELQRRFVAISQTLQEFGRTVERSGVEHPLETIQYYVPMGYEVQVGLDCSLASAVYIAELRSGQTVHPTLRKVAQKMASFLEYELGVECHADEGPEAWTLKRGTQDIVQVQKED